MLLEHMMLYNAVSREPPLTILSNVVVAWMIITTIFWAQRETWKHIYIAHMWRQTKYLTNPAIECSTYLRYDCAEMISLKSSSLHSVCYEQILCWNFFVIKMTWIQNLVTASFSNSASLERHFFFYKIAANLFQTGDVPKAKGKLKRFWVFLLYFIIIKYPLVVLLYLMWSFSQIFADNGWSISNQIIGLARDWMVLII